MNDFVDDFNEFLLLLRLSPDTEARGQNRVCEANGAAHLGKLDQLSVNLVEPRDLTRRHDIRLEDELVVGILDAGVVFVERLGDFSLFLGGCDNKDGSVVRRERLRERSDDAQHCEDRTYRHLRGRESRLILETVNFDNGFFRRFDLRFEARKRGGDFFMVSGVRNDKKFFRSGVERNRRVRNKPFQRFDDLVVEF